VSFSRDRPVDALAGKPGYYLPHVHGETVPRSPPSTTHGCRALGDPTPHTELADMFMTEAAAAARGLHVLA